jgi:endonuclease YncB( thermonuclease family)
LPWASPGRLIRTSFDPKTLPDRLKILAVVAAILSRMDSKFRQFFLRIRLQGIDAPEIDQTCGVWLCGRAAREELRRHIGLGQITCVTDGKDIYGRWLATCSTDAGDIGDWLVRQGLAVAFVRYSTKYVGAEALARAARKGLWASAFEMPWDWRGEHRGRK